MKSSVRLFQIVIVAGISLYAAKATAFTLTFDDLPTLGSTDGSQSFTDANGGSNIYQGVNFTATHFRVIGDEYRIGGPAPHPTFGLPRSGNFFVNNGNTPNDNVIITTSNVLTEAWFGRNTYYGYDAGGATSVTVTAFGAGGDLDSATIELPDTNPYTANLTDPDRGNGLADPLVRLDTSSFLSLSGITGYRISRVETNEFGGDWVGDDFTFVPPSPQVSVPEPSMSTGLLSLGLMGLVSMWKRKTN